MPSIVSYVICDGIQNIPMQGGGVAPHLIAPTLAIRPQSLPTNFSFGLSIGIQDVDINVQNTFQVKIFSPAGTLIHDSLINTISPSPIDNKLPEKYRGIVIAADLRNVYLSEVG